MGAAGVYGPAAGETLPFVVPSYVSVIGEYSDESGWMTELVGNMMGGLIIEPVFNSPIMALGDYMEPVAQEIVPTGAEGVVLKNLVFHSNEADNGAAGLNAFGSQVTIDNCGFFSLTSWAGSAIFAEDSDITITRSVFAENGGGYMNGFSAEDVGYDVDLSDLRLDKLPAGADGVKAQQFAANYGGAVLAWYSNFNVSESVFVFNSAYQAGGAILADSSTLVTNKCDFVYNFAGGGMIDSFSAEGAKLGDYLGTKAAEVWVEPFGGGAVCTLLGEYSADQAYFVMNQADPGAAVVSYINNTKLDRCLIAAHYGAAVVSFSEELLPTSFGSADYGIAIEPEPEPVVLPAGLDIDRSEFYDNDGFFTVYSTTQPTRITNSEFAGNSSMVTVALEGGALIGSAEIIEPEPTYEGSVEGCTFTRNYVEYAVVNGPIYDPIPLVNSILWENGMWDPMYSASNVEAYNVDFDGEFDAMIQEDCFSEDPMFADPDNYDFSLVPGSPCIDTGTSAPEYPEFTATEAALGWELRPWDITNLGRPLDGDGDGEALFDVGAFEYLSSTRTSGLTRFVTSVEVSRQHFGTSDAVVIATGRVFADGLAGSGLAGLVGAPILLTEPGFLPQDVADEIVRLGATKAYILGGPVAVSPAVEAALADLGLEIERIGGVDRYETAAMIGEYLMNAWGTMMPLADGGPVIAFIARGDLYADALAVSPVAYANRIPVLLVEPDALPEHTVDILREMGVDEAVVLGGGVAVNDVVAAGVGALAEEVTRIDGADRYETAANIAEWAYAEYFANFTHVGIATGDDFADALSGGAGIGSLGGVLLLTPSTMVSTASEAAIVAHAAEIQALIAFGGPSAIADDVYDHYMGLLP
jgi:putative cell wall-binding protein